MFALDEYQEELLVANTKLEDELLEIEMLLQEALYSAFGNYKEKVTAVNAVMKNKTSEYISKVLEF